MPAVNPYIDASPWGSCTIGGAPVVGKIVSINGVEKPEDITFQKGTNGNNAVSIWNGTKLMEAAEFAIKLFTSEQYAGHETLRRTIRPKIGTQPPSLPIVNPIFNGEGVSTVICRAAPPPLWVAGGGGYWLAKVVVSEFNPPTPAKVGRAKPAQYQQAPQKTAAEKEFEQLAKEAAAL